MPGPGGPPRRPRPPPPGCRRPRRQWPGWRFPGGAAAGSSSCASTAAAPPASTSGRRCQHKMPDQLAVALGKAGGDIGGGDQPQPLAAAGQRRRQQQIIGPVPGGIAQAGRAVLHGGPLVGKAHPAGHVGVIDGAAGAQHRKTRRRTPRRGPLPGPVAPADPLQGGGIGGAGLLDGGLDGKAVPQMLGGSLLLGRRAQRGKVLLHRPTPRRRTASGRAAAG